MWTEMKPFMPLGTLMQELYDAIQERYEALRYVLQTYHSADLESSNMSTFNNYMNRCKPFIDPFTMVINLHPGSYQIFQRNSTTVSGLNYYWCKTPNLIDGRIESYYENHTGSMFDRVPGYSGGINDYGQSRGSCHNNMFYDIVEDLIWCCDHAFYIGVQNAHEITASSMYNFATGMGARNFAYGDVTQMP